MLKAADFYFYQLNTEEFFSTDPCFVITPKKLWDKKHQWDDRGGRVPRKILPEGFYEAMEAVYEGTGSVSKCRQQLLDAGFIENPNLVQMPLDFENEYE